MLTLSFFCCCSVTNSCPTFCDPMACSMPGFLPFTISPSLPILMFSESVMPSNHLIHCHPLSVLPSIFPSIRVFSNELAFHISCKVFKLQHQSFQWMFRVDFLYDGLVWSPCSPISTAHWYNWVMCVCVCVDYIGISFYFFSKRLQLF